MPPRARVTGSRHVRPRWGQNFLVAESVARWIVEWAAIEGTKVLEIGPGHGALTGLLLERASFVRAVEIDERLAQELTSLHAAAGRRLQVRVGDVLTLPLDEILDPGMAVVANLPYESAAAIIRRLLSADPTPTDIVVMVQREVCLRLASRAGDRDYGLLALHTSLRADVIPGKIVAPGSFRPSPKVQSQVVRLRPLRGFRYPVGDERLLSEIAAVAFGMRRKMVRNTIVPYLRDRIGAEGARSALEESGIDSSQRPETIPPESFARLSSLVHRRISGDA
jgi:16S rRNA (adenine1518-N6/adenine1519-N6)-dimethyltransferase